MFGSTILDLAISPIAGLLVLGVVAYAVRADARRVLAPPVVRSPRMQRVFRLIRLEFAVAIAAVILTGLVIVASPTACACGMFSEPPEPSLLQQLLPWIGPAGIVVGFAAMFRLSRIDPEAGERSWRYRG